MILKLFIFNLGSVAIITTDHGSRYQGANSKPLCFLSARTLLHLCWPIAPNPVLKPSSIRRRISVLHSSTHFCCIFVYRYIDIWIRMVINMSCFCFSAVWCVCLCAVHLIGLVLHGGPYPGAGPASCQRPAVRQEDLLPGGEICFLHVHLFVHALKIAVCCCCVGAG